MNIPTKQEMEQALTARAGEKIQKAFQNSTVAICGLGGLGSNIAISLARAGVGRLILVDFDTVDVTNLNRQQYKACQIGMEKPQALRENLLEIAPYLEISAHTAKITPENAEGLLKSADVICEAFDRAEEKSMLTDTVLTRMPSKILVAASGMAGLGCPNEITTRKITQNFYLCGDGCSDVEQLGSLFAPRVMLCASHQALTVLRILAGETDRNEELKYGK